MMFTTKRALIIPIVILVLISIVTAVLPGCGSKKAATIPSANPPIFSVIDGEILRSAYTEYDNLKNTSSPEEARQQLLDKLNTQTEGVETAKLGVDGYTIFITYKDGDFAAVDTFDAAELASKLKETSYSPNSSLSDNIIASASNFSTGLNIASLVKVNYSPKDVGVGGFESPLSAAAIPVRTTALSKRVLILCPLDPKPDATTAPADCIKLLKEHGWTDSDITVKKNTDSKGPGTLNVKFEDYRQIGDYGVILYFGHGSAKDNYREDNILLQCCTMTKEELEGREEYRDWKRDGKLWVYYEYTSNDGSTILYDLYIRGDLLRQIIGPLPRSYVQLATCFGVYFNKIFTDNGARVFLGWDEVVLSTIADANQINMLTLMLNRDLSVYDAFQDGSINKEYLFIGYSNRYAKDQYDPVTGYLKLGATKSHVIEDLMFELYPSFELASNYYLPTWINLTVTGISDGTTMITASILDENGKTIVDDNGIPVVQAQNVSAGQTEVKVELMSNSCFPPGKYKIKITAYDLQQLNGNVIINEHDATLLCGANNVTFKMEKLVTPFKVWVTATEDSSPAITSMPAGPNKVIYIWTQVESGATLDVTLVIKCPNNDPDDLSFKQTPGKPTMRLRMSGYYFENPGIMTIDAISPTGEKIGATTLSLN